MKVRRVWFQEAADRLNPGVFVGSEGMCRLGRGRENVVKAAVVFPAGARRLKCMGCFG